MLKRLLIRLLRLLRVQGAVPESFLIPAYAGLGNFIMATPMVLALRRRHPGARSRCSLGRAMERMGLLIAAFAMHLKKSIRIPGKLPISPMTSCVFLFQ